MKINWNYLKLMLLLVLVMGLYAFSNHRSSVKAVNDIDLQFLGDENLYTTHEMVNKLLIQKYGNLKNVPKEKLVLNTIEKVIETDEMVKNAQVYLTVDGKLTSKIIQRKPIGRVEGVKKYYVDDEGRRMPFSKIHSARVPIITGNITGKSLEDIYVILEYINTDNFLRKNIIGIHVGVDGDYQLKFRMENFVVNLGGVENLKEKFNNFMAFYNKATKDKTLNHYDLVSLEYNNQVVCTKI
ncbi:cell division protein FtsQ/DivIB [Sediminicola luteus]|uniref:Cell division protein FtsQ n=1 Tax=Sediminicola luteus TaxID=319238 RepID=A0ABV2TXJ1_9FLAO